MSPHMRRFRNWSLRFVVVATAAALACAAAPAAGPPIPIAAGVTVDGIPIGGFTSEPARALLHKSFAQPVELQVDGRSWQMTPEQLGAAASVDVAVAAALTAPVAADLELEVAVRDSTLRWFAKRLDRSLARPARNSELLGLTSDLRPIISPSSAGRALDHRVTKARIEQALRTTAREPVRLAFKRLEPTVTQANFGPVVVIRRDSKGLYLHEGSSLVRQMPIATGTARYPTPIGTFSIVDMQRHPWWYPPDSDWAKDLKPVPPGPGNPLGTRWMGLSAWGVGIHGTPDAASVGYSASHGCIRMYVSDAEWLFQRVRIGTPVVIVSA
jgi:lipoprotein-anchoring transpeptidase ErfK/SrfK